MAPEAHGAQVLQDPDYRPKNVLHSNKNTGVCYILSFIMFSPKHMAAEANGAQVLPDLDYGPKTIICPH